jgi:hypothetical protein
MTRLRYLILSSISALALAAAPLQIDLAKLTLDQSLAFAKGGNGNGGNGGNGNGGNGGSRGGASNGKSAGGSKTDGAKGQGQQASALGRSLGSLLGGNKEKAKSERRAGKAKVTVAATGPSKRQKHAKQQVAVLPETVVPPEVKPKNFNAKLGALNSLKRNYQAYIHAKSPRFAPVAAFVMASAQYELAVEAVTAGELSLAKAQEDFAATVAAAQLTAYDGTVDAYNDATVESLGARLNTLKAITEVDPALEAERLAEIAAIESVLAGTEAKSVTDAQTSLDEAKALAETTIAGTDETALREALLSMANANRVAEYGDDYLDAETMDWAKAVLGVDEAVGKIDQVKAALSDAQ